MTQSIKFYSGSIIGNVRIFDGRFLLNLRAFRYVLSEKIGPNIQLLQNSFLSLIINNWTRTSILEPFWAPTNTWGALGGPGGLLGALLAPKLPFPFRDQF